MKTFADYPTLFELHPIGSEPPVAQRAITPGCLLPLAEAERVDVNRAARIFGVARTGVHRLRRLGAITGFQIDEDHSLQISYASIVDFCDQLRVKYHIADRRPPRKPGFRWRDEQLLPFPMSDTVSIKEVMVGCGLEHRAALHLCEEGRFECYRLDTGKGWPWRISKTSLFAMRDQLRQSLAARRQ